MGNLFDEIKSKVKENLSSDEIDKKLGDYKAKQRDQNKKGINNLMSAIARNLNRFNVQEMNDAFDNDKDEEDLFQNYKGNNYGEIKSDPSDLNSEKVEDQKCTSTGTVLSNKDIQKILSRRAAIDLDDSDNESEDDWDIEDFEEALNNEPFKKENLESNFLNEVFGTKDNQEKVDILNKNISSNENEEKIKEINNHEVLMPEKIRLPKISQDESFLVALNLKKEFDKEENLMVQIKLAPESNQQKKEENIGLLVRKQSDLGTLFGEAPQKSNLGSLFDKTQPRFKLESNQQKKEESLTVQVEKEKIEEVKNDEMLMSKKRRLPEIPQDNSFLIALNLQKEFNTEFAKEEKQAKTDAELAKRLQEECDKEEEFAKQKEEQAKKDAELAKQLQEEFAKQEETFLIQQQINIEAQLKKNDVLPVFNQEIESLIQQQANIEAQFGNMSQPIFAPAFNQQKEENLGLLAQQQLKVFLKHGLITREEYNAEKKVIKQQYKI